MSNGNDTDIYLAIDREPPEGTVLEPPSDAPQEPPGGWREQNPEAVLAAMQEDREIAEMDRQVRNMVDEGGQHLLSFDELAAWETMSTFEKRNAYRSGRYTFDDPLISTTERAYTPGRGFSHEGQEIAGEGINVLGVPLGAARPFRELSPEAQIQHARMQYGDRAITSNAEGEDQIDQRFVENVQTMRQTYNRATTLGNRPIEYDEQGYAGSIGVQDMLQDAANWQLQRQQRRARLQQRVLEDQQEVFAQLLEISESEIEANQILAAEEWQQAVEESRRFAPLEVEQMARSQDNHVQMISVDDMFPHLMAQWSQGDWQSAGRLSTDASSQAIEDWMWLTESLPRGVPIEAQSMESDVEWSLNDRDIDEAVVNLDVIAAIIAEERITADYMALGVAERPRRMGAENRARYDAWRAERFEAYEAEALERLQQIRRRADGTHFALFDPDGKSLATILTEMDQGDGYWGSVVDAWWSGSGTNKSSVLYLEGETLMVEHEGLLDWSWRGLAGLSMGAGSAISEERSISDIYHGAGFGAYADDVGYAGVDMVLGGLRYAGITDMEADEFPLATQLLGTTYVTLSTVATPDVITVGTFGVGAIGKTGGVAAGIRALKMEGVAAAAEDVSGLGRALRMARSGTSGFISGVAGAEEVALMAAKGRYLLAESDNFMHALSTVRLAEYQAATTRAATYADEAEEVAAMLNRVEKVLGKSEADIIRVQYQNALASNTSVSRATYRHTQRAVQAEARLSEGVRPVTWEASSRGSQRTAQARRGLRNQPQLPPTTGVRRGGIGGGPGRPGGAGGKVRLGSASRRVPTNVQDDAINMVREAVESGRPVWTTLKNQINPITKKKWTKAQIREVATLELRATEAAHISLGANLAELLARRNILRSFAGKQRGTAGQMRTAALNARRALDRLKKARRELHALERGTARPAVKTSDAWVKAQTNIEKARRQVDAAMEHLGQVSGKAAHTFLDNRITRAQELFNKTGSHLKGLATGISKELGAVRGRGAGLHNSKQHGKHVGIAMRQARDTYMVPGYRILGNIVREAGVSKQGLAKAWADPRWTKLPTFKQAMRQLETAGFLGRRIGSGGFLTTIAGIGPKAQDVIQDVNGLAAKLLDMYDIAVLERVAARGTPEADMLLGVLRSSSTRPLPAITKQGLAKNIEILTNEHRAIMISERGGAMAAATLLDVADLSRHSPGMVNALFTQLASRVPAINTIRRSVSAFVDPHLYKIGFGNVEVTNVMKGIEYTRKYHAQNLTYIATTGKQEARFGKVAEYMSSNNTFGYSAFDQGLAWLRRIGNSSDKGLKYASDQMFEAIGRAFIGNSRLHGGFDARMFPKSATNKITQAEWVTSQVKKAVMDGKVSSWDELLDVIYRTTTDSKIGKGSAVSAYRNAIAKGEKPAREAMEQALYSHTIVGQTIITAAALEDGLSSAAKLTAHLSDDAIEGLARLQRGEAAALGTTFDEIAEVSNKLGIPPRMGAMWKDTSEEIMMAITAVKKDGGVTFLNQRAIETTIKTLQGTIKNTKDYFKTPGPMFHQYLGDWFGGMWTNVLRMMTTGAFHLGYWANMTYGNFTQTFAEEGFRAAMQVAAGGTVGAITPALTRVPVIGPRLASKYNKHLADLTLPHPGLAMVDARTAAFMDPKMLSADKIVVFPSGEKMTVGAFRKELVEAGAFTGLTASIAPATLKAANRQGFLQRAFANDKLPMPSWLKPTRAISKPLEMFGNLFNHLEVLQRVTLYNFLRFNKGYSKGRSTQILQNSLYDWAFASTEAEKWYSSIIMFYNFHRLSFMRGFAHMKQPLLAGAGRGGPGTVGTKGFVNGILRTSPMHPDAFAMARINMYDRAHRTFVEDPGLEEAGVDRPGWGRTSPRTFAGGGMLTEVERLMLMEMTGRDANAFIESLPAPTPQSVIETFYNLTALSIRAGIEVPHMLPEALGGEGDTAPFEEAFGGLLKEGAAREFAARANPFWRSIIEDYAGLTPYHSALDTEGLVPLYSPTHRWLQNHLEAIVPYWESDRMYREDRPHAMRVSPLQKAILGLLLLPIQRKFDPIVESEALDMNTREALGYWIRQNAGVGKRHYINPELEEGYREAQFDREVEEYVEEVIGTMPGGIVAGEGAERGPSLEAYEARREQRNRNLRDRRAMGDREGFRPQSVEDQRRTAYINRVLRGEE